MKGEYHEAQEGMEFGMLFSRGFGFDRAIDYYWTINSPIKG